jgi:hypothetical protein
MAGERWAQVKQLFALLDLAPLAAAADDWHDFADILSTVERGFYEQRWQLNEAEWESRAGDALYVAADRTGQALTDAVEEIGSSTVSTTPSYSIGPGTILESLATTIERFRRGIAQEDADYPTALSGDPDMRLLQEIRIGEFDQRADYWVEVLTAALAVTTTDMERISLGWVLTLPQADPSADPASLGG